MASVYCIFLILLTYILLLGQKCDQHGINITADSPPPPHDSDCGPHNWTPYAG